MENKTMVITRPQHDDTTAYLHAWTADVINVAKKNDFSVIDLEMEKATRKNLESVLKKQNPIFVFINGHGSTNFVCGQNYDILVKAGVNENILSGKITYTISCESASVLGPAAVDKGARVFIGYNEKFGFVYDNNSTTKPLQDRIAKPFFESSNKVSTELLRGKSAQVSVDKSQETFQKWIDFYKNSKEPEAPDVLTWLIWDKEAQVLLGDREAQIV